MKAKREWTRIFWYSTSFSDALDKHALAEAAHGLKGICANIGATQLQHLAFDIEQAGREGKTLDGPQTMEIFRTAVIQVTHCLGSI